MIETGNSQARILNGYNGPLTVCVDGKVVNDSATKEEHLARILGYILEKGITHSIEVYGKHVVTSNPEVGTSDPEKVSATMPKAKNMFLIR